MKEYHTLTAVSPNLLSYSYAFVVVFVMALSGWYLNSVLYHATYLGMMFVYIILWVGAYADMGSLVTQSLTDSHDKLTLDWTHQKMNICQALVGFSPVSLVQKNRQLFETMLSAQAHCSDKSGGDVTHHHHHHHKDGVDVAGETTNTSLLKNKNSSLHFNTKFYTTLNQWHLSELFISLFGLFYCPYLFFHNFQICLTQHSLGVSLKRGSFQKKKKKEIPQIHTKKFKK
ncbi:hypothetical protein RFI_10658 [Reticulomyxa filosa]|uniref:Uncharacterized protein n=1 Tax=Reticulomyxa filosa TaxID=46433 RepID=X6NL97_RETFI|nr:hypothetical protein RFI_10658 [Reticulomyxa filosa]|eukprot:ETO26479.1 hypothetical protein RFI_10658 [Reticulomyxa filosa]